MSFVASLLVAGWKESRVDNVMVVVCRPHHRRLFVSSWAPTWLVVVFNRQLVDGYLGRHEWTRNVGCPFGKRRTEMDSVDG